MSLRARVHEIRCLGHHLQMLRLERRAGLRDAAEHRMRMLARVRRLQACRRRRAEMH